MNDTLRRYENQDELFEHLGAALQQSLQQALRQRDRALIGLSGGRTPLPLYRRLCDLAIDWRRVHFALVDERWVSVDDEASNEYQLRRALAPALSGGAVLSGMKNEALTPALGHAACERQYRELPLPFDCILLGMGEDGHTASLFPQAAGLDDALGGANVCAPITAVPSAVTGPLVERMSLGLQSILNAGAIELLITGSGKLEVLEQARAGDDAREMPVRALLRAGKLRVWYAP